MSIPEVEAPPAVESAAPAPVLSQPQMGYRPATGEPRVTPAPRGQVIGDPGPGPAAQVRDLPVDRITTDGVNLRREHEDISDLADSIAKVEAERPGACWIGGATE